MNDNIENKNGGVAEPVKNNSVNNAAGINTNNENLNAKADESAAKNQTTSAGMTDKLTAAKVICAILILTGICIYLFSETMTLMRWLPSILGLLTLLGIIIYDFNYISGKVNTRSFKYTTNAIVYSIIIIVITGLINFIVFKHDKQWDLTQNKRFSLSEQSIKLLKNLKSEVEIIMFYPDISKMQFNDLFKQYSYHSDKFKTQFYDINKNPQLAKRYNVTTGQTAVIKFKDRTEKLQGNFAEPELTNAIIRVSRESKKGIYFLTGHNEADCDAMTEKGMSALKDTLIELNYEVKKLNLLQEQKIPANCAALIIAGPQTELTPDETGYITSYLNAGGKAFIMLDVKPFARRPAFTIRPRSRSRSYHRSKTRL